MLISSAVVLVANIWVVPFMLETRASPRKIPSPDVSTFFIYPVFRSVFFYGMFINFLVLGGNSKQSCEQTGILFSPQNRLPGNSYLNFIVASCFLRNETTTTPFCFIGKVSSKFGCKYFKRQRIEEYFNTKNISVAILKPFVDKNLCTIER